MGGGQNGVSGVFVNRNPLEKSHAEPGREPEGNYGTVLVQNTKENSAMEKLLNMEAALTLISVIWKLSCPSGASGVTANLTVGKTPNKPEAESVFLTFLNTNPMTTVFSMGSLSLIVRK